MTCPEIATLGPEKTHSSLAAMHYAPGTDLWHRPTIDDVVATVAARYSQWGLLPLENSKEGAVVQTLNSLYEHRSGVKIIDRLSMPIHQALSALTAKDADARAERVYSHPQALAQCKVYLDENYPKIERHEVASTVAGMELIVERQDINALAIGPEAAIIDHSALRLVDSDIEDDPDNETQFVVFTAFPEIDQRTDFTIAALVPEEDHFGLLADAFTIIKNARVNNWLVQSRTNKARLGSYMFYVGMDLASDDVRYGEIANNLSSIDVVIHKLTV